MARILFTTTPSSGHINPFLPVVQEMVQRGHTVGWYTSEVFREKIERIGATLFPIKEAFDLANRSKEEAFPHLQNLTGLQDFIGSWTSIFLNPAPRHLLDLEAINQDFKADVLVSDETSFAPGFLKEKTGTPHVIIATSIYFFRSKDTAPLGMGMLPLPGPVGRFRNMLIAFMADQLLLSQLRKTADQTRLRAGLQPIPGGVLQNVIVKPDRYLLSTVPMFEYPRRDLIKGTEFIGPLLDTVSTRAFTPPHWWKELYAERPVIHVTQGTVNNNASDLLLPAIKGLANENMLVIGTTGGTPLDMIPFGQLARNTRLETFIPHIELMSHVDVVITNGGYGGVQQALAHGKPLVIAGATEEKMDVAAHVQWLGAGINLRTNKPKPEQIHRAVKRVLKKPMYRSKAERIQAEYEQYDAPKLAAKHIEALLQERGINPPTPKANE